MISDEKVQQKSQMLIEKKKQKKESVQEEKKLDPMIQKSKPTESKIPQKIQSKPQNVVKTSASEGASVSNQQDVALEQNVLRAGGEQMSAVPLSKPDVIKDSEQSTPMKKENNEDVHITSADVQNVVKQVQRFIIECKQIQI